MPIKTAYRYLLFPTLLLALASCGQGTPPNPATGALNTQSIEGRPPSEAAECLEESEACTADDAVTADVIMSEPVYSAPPEEDVPALAPGEESERPFWPFWTKNAKVRIVIDAVACHDTEDWMGADEIYMGGNIAIGLPSGKKVDVPYLTAPAFDCNDGQWKQLDLPVFSEVLPADSDLEANLVAYDEDFGKDWAKVGPDFMNASKAVADLIASAGGSKGKMISDGLKAGMQVIDAAAKADKDDVLGLAGLPYTVAATAQSSTRWGVIHFQKTSRLKFNRYEHKIYFHIEVIPTYNAVTIQ